MISLVLYFDYNRSTIDVEYEGRVMNTAPFGKNFKIKGLTLETDEEGQITKEDLDHGVEVGSYDEEGTFVEYLFSDLDLEDVL